MTTADSGGQGERLTRLVHVTTIPLTLLFFRGQVRFMRDHGIETRVISSPGKELDAFSREEGVEVAAIDMPRRISPATDLRGVTALARVLRRWSPDIIHGHTPKAGLLAMLAGRATGVERRIYHMRGLPMETASGWRRALLKRTEWIACKAATHVVCVGASLRSRAIAEGVVNAEKAEVLCGGSSNGVDAKRLFAPDSYRAERNAVRRELGISDHATVFIFVGRLVRDKGVEELVDAWESVRSECPGARLLIIGGYEARDAVPEAARRRLESDDLVLLQGFRTDIPRLYACADVVVHPSHREGFPNVPLEGAAMALPVISTFATGCVDAVANGETGTLVPVGDARSLAAAMTAYSRDPQLRADHGAAGRRRVLEQFRPEQIWEALLELYRRSAARGDVRATRRAG